MPRFPRALLAALLGLTAIRLLLAAALPLGDDEAYYWEWSRHLAAGYVDHPPAIAYLVRAAVQVLGRTPFAIHAVAVVLSFATSLALFTLAREVTGRDEAAAGAVLVYAIVPVFAAGALLATPDAPLFLCWVMTLVWTWRAARAGGWSRWLLAGVWLGLGLQSKYAAAVLPLSAGVWLWARRARLPHPGWRGPAAAVACGLVIFSPVIWWNARHHWVSFALTALGTSRWTEQSNAPQFLAAQFLYAGPLLFPAMLAALGAAAWRGAGARDPGWSFLAAAGWPIVLGAGAGSLFVSAKPHWTAPGYLAGAVALGALATETPGKPGPGTRRPLVRLVLVPSVILAACFYALPLLTAPVVPPQLDPAANYYGWDRAGPEILAIARRESRRPFFIASDWYQVMAPFDFSTGGRAPATTITGDDQYRLWTPLSAYRGWDGLFVRDSRQTYDVDLAQVCGALEPAGSVPLRRGATVIRRVDLLWCRRYSGTPVPRLPAFRWAPGTGGSPLRVSPGAP
jgi:4-amino-4-deoxy-L-arabinose transferase-like glycosyltransferase